MFIIKNKELDASVQIDKWAFNGQKAFRDELLRSLKHQEDNYYYAISCNCCDPVNSEIYKKLLNVPHERLTFANLWINGNYTYFKENIGKVGSVHLITNANAYGRKYPFEVSSFYPIPHNCVEYYEQDPDRIHSLLNDFVDNAGSGQVFLVAAGALSEILVHKMFQRNPNNCYVDIGSALDLWTFGKATRPYHNPEHGDALKLCDL